VFGNFSIWPFGVQFGNNAAWPPSSEGCWEQLDKSGSVDMMHSGDFFRSRTWYDLIPDQKHKVVISGLGEFRGLDYLSTAVSSEGRTLDRYIPTSRKITVHLSKLSAKTIIVSWYHPRTGKSVQG
jgi:hypothetical protein